MQDAPKAVWSIPYVSVAFLPTLRQNFIAYHSSKVSWRPDCIFEIHQLWQSGFSRVYSNSCCSCSFEAEIIKIGQSSHKMYSNKILNFQVSMTILNACRKKSGNLLKAPRIYIEREREKEKGVYWWMCVSMFSSVYIIINIMSRSQHWSPWPSLAIHPYGPSLLDGLQGYILYQHRTLVYRFVVRPLLVYVKGSTGVYRFWVRPYFSSNVSHVRFV